MTQAKTQYQYVEFTMDGTWSSLKQHRTKAKTQYQNVKFSMDDRDWFDMMVHGHHWNNIWPQSKPNTNLFNLVWMIGVSFDMSRLDQSSALSRPAFRSLSIQPSFEHSSLYIQKQNKTVYHNDICGATCISDAIISIIRCSNPIQSTLIHLSKLWIFILSKYEKHLLCSWWKHWCNKANKYW